MSDTNFQLPEFASLANCLLIESSFRSRIEITKDIKACALFEDIIDAGSIINAQELLKVKALDACIFGPSLSQSVVSSFIKKAKAESISSDCAYIAIIKSTAEISEYPDPHSVVTSPCSKRILFEAIVRGILIANEGSVWPGIRLTLEGSIEMLEGGTWKILAGGPIPTTPILPEDFILDGSQESIKSFCESLSTTPKSRIDKIVRSLLTSPQSSEDPFVQYFLAAIEEWREDQSFLSLKEVSKNLRKKLLEFKF